MPQIFHRSTNTSRAPASSVRCSSSAAVWVPVGVHPVFVRDTARRGHRANPCVQPRSPRGPDRIDCRYCHTSVEKSSFAAFADGDLHELPFADLERTARCSNRCARASETGKPLRWSRVHDLARIRLFDHSVHIKQGRVAVSCHGQVR